ncbi:MAG: hypothetical protein A2W91_19350 [Bacteroidetes bacterium GWF2_38_335]|nr:MAG: hypothetical protein A2W91_19350 [Bacteroidetes bacterium GWF2_38_335]OFY79915.1 MAG: hypothetical protein A2281_10750 [Bacteroidetes bacterium RIFOXYA12_FULL_38_20]HBS86372.1 hypothetical protein [Bacteroidales bacterium]
MEVLTVVLLVGLGIILLLLEFFVVPGITIFGFAGFAAVIGGIYFAFDYFGQMGGMYAILGSSLAIGIMLYLAFKAKTWDKAMLKTDISGKVDSIDPNEVKQGDTGKTVSRLAPIGKIIINEKYYEGKSIDSFIDHGVDIEVVKVEMTQIIVKPKK